MEVKKLSIIDKIYLNLKLPDLDEYKKENSDKKIRLRLVDINKIKYLEKLAARVKGYLTQLNQQFKEIDKLKESVKKKENSRRKTVGKVGGLQASLNKERDKNKELLKHTEDLNNIISDKNEEIENKVLELQAKDMEIKILKNLGKKKKIEDYKKLSELKKDLEKNRKNKNRR